MTNGVQWHPLLASDVWFNESPALLQDSLLKGMRQRRVTPGKLIYARGDLACGMYALIEGTLRFNGIDQQDAELEASIKRPFWFGELPLYDGSLRRHDVYAENQVILLHMPHAPLKQVLDENRYLWRFMGQVFGRKLGLQVPFPEEITLLPTEQRVAFRLLMLSECYGEIDRSLRVVAFADMASPVCLGLTPEVVERELNRLEARDVLEWDGELISVHDPERLRRAARHRLTPDFPW